MDFYVDVAMDKFPELGIPPQQPTKLEFCANPNLPPPPPSKNYTLVDFRKCPPGSQVGRNLFSRANEEQARSNRGASEEQARSKREASGEQASNKREASEAQSVSSRETFENQPRNSQEATGQ